MDTNNLVLLFKSIALPLVGAGALAWIAWSMIANLFKGSKTATQKHLDEFNRMDIGAAGPKAAEARMGSKEYKIRLAFRSYGLDVAGWEQVAMFIAYGLFFAAASAPVIIVGLPVVLLVGAPFLGYIVVNAMVDSKWEALKLSMEKELPVMLTRLSSLLKANPNMIETLNNVAEGLDPDKPLSKWISRLANKLQASGHKGLDEMKAEAEMISSSLLLAAVEIGRVWETGGGGYTEALRMAADNLSDLMETRSQAQAVANGAWGTARTILMAVGLTMGLVLVNPVSKKYFDTPLMQAALVGMMVWAGLGYMNIRDAINEVLE